MSVVQKITREPALIVGLVTAGLGLAVLFGVHVTEEQVGGIVVFLGALMALVRFLTTPSGEVLAQVTPSGVIVAGSASTVQTGEPLGVAQEQYGGEVIAAAPVKAELLA